MVARYVHAASGELAGILGHGRQAEDLARSGLGDHLMKPRVSRLTSARGDVTERHDPTVAADPGREDLLLVIPTAPIAGLVNVTGGSRVPSMVRPAPPKAFSATGAPWYTAT